MKTSSIIGHVREALEEFFASDRIPSDLLLRKFTRQRRYLGSRDRREIAALYYDFLRLAPRWFRQIGEDERGSVETLPRAFAISLLVSSAVDEKDVSVGCGVDSNDLDIHLGPAAGDRLPADEFGLPVWLYDRFALSFGNETRDLCRSLLRPAPIGLRVNQQAISREEAAAEITEATSVDAAPSPYAPHGLRLEKRIALDAIKAVRIGHVVVQSEASQLAVASLGDIEGRSVFDACAGAGGKTLQLASVVGRAGHVFADDIDQTRLRRLEHRIRASRYGDRVRVCSWGNIEEADRPDVVLVDAPCSGSGTLWRNPGMRLRLEAAALTSYRATQASILKEWESRIEVGGTIVYATCSLLPEENEEQVADFLALFSGWERVDLRKVRNELPDAVFTEVGDIATTPHRHGIDGFYVAVLRCVHRV